jgi:hypothetical protein
LLALANHGNLLSPARKIAGLADQTPSCLVWSEPFGERGLVQSECGVAGLSWPHGELSIKEAQHVKPR